MHRVIVIGAGPGGYVAAIRAAQLGLSVALVDRRTSLGGTCLNIGCIPSKALLEATELLARVRRDAAAHGVVAASVTVDLAAMMKRKDQVVRQLAGGVAQIVKARGVTVVEGSARIVSAGKVAVTAASGKEQVLEGDSIVVATGSDVQTLPFLRLDGTRVVSSTEALSFPEVPPRLLVIGAGAIGVEMGACGAGSDRRSPSWKSWTRCSPGGTRRSPEGCAASCRGRGWRLSSARGWRRARSATACA